MYSKISGLRSWGDIYGLEISDLSTEALYKLNFEKLLECIEDDQRVPYIIAARILDAKIEEIKYFQHIPEEKIVKFPNIISIYNRYIEKNRTIIDRLNAYQRYYTLQWCMLNEENKKIELQRWKEGKYSIINETSIDYEWIYSIDPEYGNHIIDKIFQRDRYRNFQSSAFYHMIKNIPKQKTPEIMERIFGLENKYLHMNALSNKHISDEYIIKGLRILADRTHIPEINAAITKDILEKLPTITRLKVIEKLVQRSVKIKGFKDKDEFKTLFLGSIMRYPRRVEYIINNLNSILEITDE